MTKIAHIALPAILAGTLFLGGCATRLNDADEAKLTQAVQDAAEAKQIAQQALAASQAATASANHAAESAQAANEKADRIFQRSLRK
jgi:hypothetical protein